MRSFEVSTAHVNSKNVPYTGRFISNVPSGAAKKAFSKIYHHLNKSGPLSMKIVMQETTSGSAKKLYSYKVTKVAQKSVVEKGGELITFNFTTKCIAI